MSRRSPRTHQEKSPESNQRDEDAENDASETDDDISKSSNRSKDKSVNHRGSDRYSDSSSSPGSPAITLRSHAGFKRKNVSGSSPNSNLYPSLPLDSGDDGLRPSPRPKQKVSERPNLNKNLYPEKDEMFDESAKETGRSGADGLNYSTIVMIVILAIFILCFALYAVLPLNTVELEPSSELSSFERYINGIDKLQAKFPQQSARLWRTLKASAQHTLNVSNPEYPVVVLVGANLENDHVTECIAQHVAKLYETSASNGEKVNPVSSSNVAEFKSLSASAQKKKLDTDMSSAFSRDKSKAFIISNLQLLAPDASLILHGYCDNDNAPFKDVLLLMTFYISTDVMNFDSVSPKSSEKVEEHLRNLWNQGLEKDKVDALLSRVGNNIVILTNADNEKLLAICP